jgi:hypothetical protein
VAILKALSYQQRRYLRAQAPQLSVMAELVVLQCLLKALLASSQLKKVGLVVNGVRIQLYYRRRHYYFHQINQLAARTGHSNHR